MVPSAAKLPIADAILKIKSIGMCMREDANRYGHTPC